MLKTRKSKLVSSIVATAVVAAGASVALASPGSGISGENYVTAAMNEIVHVNHDRIKFQTKDLVDVRMQKLTFGQNSRSGWHHHPGVLIVAVQSGLVTLTDARCGSKTYGPGSPNGAVFVEGDETAVEASSVAGAVAYISIIVPRGANPRIEDPVPLCATRL